MQTWIREWSPLRRRRRCLLRRSRDPRRSILIWEAPSVEDVRDVLYESGFMHWCDGRIFPSHAAARDA